MTHWHKNRLGWRLCGAGCALLFRFFFLAVFVGAVTVSAKCANHGRQDDFYRVHHNGVIAKKEAITQKAKQKHQRDTRGRQFDDQQFRDVRAFALPRAGILRGGLGTPLTTVSLYTKGLPA